MRNPEKPTTNMNVNITRSCPYQNRFKIIATSTTTPHQVITKTTKESVLIEGLIPGEEYTVKACSISDNAESKYAHSNNHLTGKFVYF